VAYSARQVMDSIFSQTRVPTDTFSNRDLALLDIDKIISLNSGSLKEQGERVKYMRMVAGLMQHNSNRSEQLNS
jgi:hypothetical protein